MNPPPALLYEACRRADPAGYEQLWPYLYRVALQLTHDPALAQDCAQMALIRIYEQIADCREPAAFYVWSRRIVSHLTIDQLRRDKRLVPLDEAEMTPAPFGTEAAALNELTQASLRQLLDQAPISDRSRRVVVGRFLEDLPDEPLADRESLLAQQPILPSHIQVTRAKNIAKLRDYAPLRRFLGLAD